MTMTTTPKNRTAGKLIALLAAVPLGWGLYQGLLILRGPGEAFGDEPPLPPAQAVEFADPASLTAWPDRPGDWPMFGHDPLHTGRCPVSFASADLVPAWDRPFSGDERHTWSIIPGTPVWSPPVVGHVPQPGGAGPPRAMLFIGAYDRGLYGLDAATGRVIWREVFSNGVVAASPALAMAKGRALLIAACTDRVLYAFEAATGKRAWSVETRPWTQSSTPAVMSSPTPAVLFGRAVVFVGVWNAERSGLANAQDGELWALDAADGSTVWKLRLGTSAATSPAVAPLRGGVTVLVAAEDGTVRALDARNGREMWVRTLHQELRSSPAVFSADGVPMLAIGTRFHSVYGLGAASGAKLWRYQTGNWVDAAPAVALTGDDEGDDAAPLVLAGSYDYSLYALSAAGKGKPAWRLPGANEFRGPAAVARVAGKPAVFAVSFDDTLHLLSADDGRPLWRHSAGPLLFGHEFQGDALWPGPVVADLGGPLGPLVFFPAHDGKLYAFRAKGS